MRILKPVFLILTVILLAAGCGSRNGMQQPNQGTLQTSTPSPAALPEGQLLAEAKEGDFVLQLVTEKDTYSVNEAIKLRVRMKYVGQLDEVQIAHAMSPFSFAITEVSRGIEVDYVMPQPLISTTLKKDVWLEEIYTKTGGYGEHDPNNQFLQNFLTGASFPEGVYHIAAYAGFTLYKGDKIKPTEEKEFAFHTEPLQINVK